MPCLLDIQLRRKALRMPKRFRKALSCFAGLRAFSGAANRDALQQLPSLYKQRPRGYAAPSKIRGKLQLTELLRHPFGPDLAGARERAEELPLVAASAN